MAPVCLSEEEEEPRLNSFTLPLLISPRQLGCCPDHDVADSRQLVDIFWPRSSSSNFHQRQTWMETQTDRALHRCGRLVICIEARSKETFYFVWGYYEAVGRIGWQTGVGLSSDIASGQMTDVPMAPPSPPGRTPIGHKNASSPEVFPVIKGGLDSVHITHGCWSSILELDCRIMRSHNRLKDGWMRVGLEPMTAAVEKMRTGYFVIAGRPVGPVDSR